MPTTLPPATLAAELYATCQRLAQGEPSPAAACRVYEVLTLVCSTQGGTYGNVFSQIDAVCRRLGITDALRSAVQTARYNSRHRQWPSHEDWLYDLRAVAQFVSAVLDTPVPSTLLTMLPPSLRPRRAAQHGARRGDVRCIVHTIDGTHVVADSDGGLVAIDCVSHSDGPDLAYLAKLLVPGMQLNLLGCNAADTSDDDAADGPVTLLPRMVVVEPDFLIDISALAACFTAYSCHTLLYTKNRLMPRPNGQALLLGTTAGCVLDDLVSLRHTNSDATYQPERALWRAFSAQPLRFCACTDFDATRFKDETHLQADHVRQAVDTLFAPGGADVSLSLLEPSFVCEKLGVQGRVDLMTADMRLLVEQKAGRNMKIEQHSHDSHGLQREDHYVQLLLYHGVLRHNFGCRQVDTRLLYSRYPAADGLLSVNYYQGLMHRAICLRNRIVATELYIARNGFGRIRPLLTTATIYREAQRDAFFASYVQPPMDAFARVLQGLSPLEQAYVDRMATFVYREEVCRKLGSAEGLRHGSGSVADLWQVGTAEKLEQGNIFTDLAITNLRRSVPYGGYDLVTLAPRQAGGQPTASNFRRGDMVWLYSYEGEPDVRRNILYKGSLADITPQGLVVRLSDGQQNTALFGNERPWAVEHGSSDSAANGNLRALYQLAQAEPRRRALLLGQRAPEADTTLALHRSYQPSLDALLLRQRQARDYFLLQGPPGTGKTSRAMRFIVEEELCTAGAAVLLTAYTNRAVDEICAMLTDAGLDFLRVGNAASCDPRYHDHLLDHAIGPKTGMGGVRRLIDRTFVVTATTSMLQSQPWLLDLKRFTLAVVDEASQILEPALVGLLSHRHIGRFVLIGDHKQLPAVVQQRPEDTVVDEPLLRQAGITDCRQSLFERLLRWEQRQGRTTFTGLLRHQGRMHPDVARFPSTRFYPDEQLDSVPLPHQQEPAVPVYSLPPLDTLDTTLCQHRVVFFDCPPAGQYAEPVPPPLAGQYAEGFQPSDSSDSSDASDSTNRAEARLVALLLSRVHRFYGERFDAATTVGVIVPYRNQIATIRQEIERLGLPALADVSIDTVERYQGSQRDVIIYSFTVSRSYQLDFLTSATVDDGAGRPIDRKLNVALTRARRQMLAVGCAEVLRHVPVFADFIDTYAVG